MAEENNNEIIEKSQRICDYYLTKRGCAKGDRCDFLHEGGKANASVEDLDQFGPKTCAFYLSERGCVKAEKCDFLHPVAPNGTKSTKICDYFQQPRGCVKGKECDFLHIRAPRSFDRAAPGGQGGGGNGIFDQAMRAQAHANQLAAAAAGMMGYPAPGGGGGYDAPGQRPAAPTNGSNSGGSRMCTFYQSDRGCAKGDRCDFVHQGPGAGMAPTQPYGAYGGGYGMEGAPGMEPFGLPSMGFGLPGSGGGGSGSGKVCSFFGTSRGCRKGDKCDFVHPVGTGTSSERSSSRYAPY